jgi:hypothetical protein
MRGISIFLDQLAEHCPDIASVWLIGARADDDTLDSRSYFGWDLVAFADDATLRRLRGATELHRDDVCLRVVTDGDHFAPAWGDRSREGALSRWRWRSAGEREAFYAQAHRQRRAIRLQSRI